MSTAADVLAALERVTGEPAVRADRDLDLYGEHVLDSLLTIELILALGRRFGVDIAVSEIDRDVWATPGRVVAFMEQRVGP